MVSTVSNSYKCNVCGKRSTQETIVNSSVNGAADLDLRPDEPHRSSMQFWTMCCPHCGYCGDNIQDYTDIKRSFLKSEKYISLDGISTNNFVATKFIHKSLALLECGDADDLEESAKGYLYASWVFEDEENVNLANECRNKCIEIIDRMTVEKPNIHYYLLKADLLRRCGRFEEVIENYSDFQVNSDVMNKVASFQVEKAKEKDISVYKISDVK